MGRRDRKKQKKKRWYKIPLIVLGILILLGGAWVLSIYNKAKSTVNDKMYQEVESIDKELSKKKMKEKDQINILVLGLDSAEGESGRTDTMIVMTLRPETDSMQLISIPRDTRTEIVGRGTIEKINHAHARGGVDMAIDTVESFLNIEIDHHIRLNMEGLKLLIDELGGITVQNDLAWSDGTYNFQEGQTDLDGEKALAYVRMRKQDPAGDFGRAKRQRQVIASMINTGASIGSIGKISGTIDILGNNMATSMDFNDMKRLFTGYMGVRHNMESYQVQGQGTTIDGTYYYIVPDEEVQHVHNMITN